MKLSWKRITVHTRHAFKIAREGSSVDGGGKDVNRIIVELEQDGITGRGEAAPTPFYGQNLDSVEATLEKVPQFLGDDPFQINPIVDRLVEAFDDQRATVCAVDQALHDWVGQKLGIPVWKLLGLDVNQTPPTSMTVGIDTPELVVAKTREIADDFSIIKVKVGTDNDDEILSAVRSAARDHKLRVDANCGWTPEIAIEQIKALDKKYNLEFIEQPIMPHQYDSLRSITEGTTLPIITDEDSAKPSDVLKLAGNVTGINIKLSKCGGIREGFDMIRLARAFGMQVMLGCMVETSIGVSAISQLAPLADYVDLDGHLLLADDPYTGPVLQNGIVSPPNLPGLGIGMKSGN